MEEQRKLKNEKGSEIERQEDTLRKGGREREYVWKMEKVCKIKRETDVSRKGELGREWKFERGIKSNWRKMILKREGGINGGERDWKIEQESKT